MAGRCTRPEGLLGSEILTVFSNILNDLILIPGQSADIVMDLPFSNSLLDGYVCIHIRRGDKLISEAEDVGELEYLARIPARFASLPVVVITDDYNAYSRLAQAMRSRDSCRMVYTTASMDARVMITKFIIAQRIYREENNCIIYWPILV